MPNSTKFNNLQNRISDLGNHLLPSINPLGNYTPKEQDMIRAYCLLVHAEIEAYIEAIILEIATLAKNKWSSDKTKITPIIFHLAFSYKQPVNKGKEPPFSMVNIVFQELEKNIKSNNGIKENNLNIMLKPIGFNMDNTLMTSLTSFGKNRGEIAHTSFHTQSVIDPVTEKSTVLTILNGLKTFDNDLIEYETNGTISTIQNISNLGMHKWLFRTNKILNKIFPKYSN